MTKDAPAQKVVEEAVTLSETVDAAEMSQKEFEALQSQASELTSEDTYVKGAAATLIHARRLYMTAMASLQQRGAELKTPENVLSFILEAAKHRASTESFERSDLLSHLQQSVVPWLTAEIQEQDEREAKMVAQEIAEEDELRRKIDIPLPFRPGRSWEKYSAAPFEYRQGEAYLGRERALTLTGHPGAVRYVLDMIVRYASLQQETGGRRKPSVMRLVDRGVQHNVVGKQDKQTFQVGVNRWLQCGRSEKAILDTLAPFFGSMLRMRVDLCVLDRLDKTDVTDKLGRPVSAANVHRKWRKWADKTGCALVFGLPLESDNPITDYFAGMTFDGVASWEQLMTFTDFVQLVVSEDSNETYRIDAVYLLDPDTSVCVDAGIDRDVITNWKQE